MIKNKETVIGWVLIAILIVGFLFYQSKQMAKAEKERKEKQLTEQAQKKQEAQKAKLNPSIQAVENTPADTSVGVVENDSLAAFSKHGAFGVAAKGTEETFTIENDVLKITLTNKGGQIKQLELKDYKTWDKKPLILLTDKSNQLSYQFFIENDRTIDTRDFYFEPNGQPFKVTGTESKSFALRLQVADGKYFEQVYTLTGNSYMVDYKVNTVGLSDVIAANNTYIGGTWENSPMPIERNLDLERRYSAVYYRFKEGDVDHLSEDSETDEYVFNSPGVEWIAFKQQFFNASLLNKEGFTQGKLNTAYKKENKDFVKKYTASFTIPYKNNGDNSYSFQYYFGPNRFKTLASYDTELEDIIKLGPDMWAFSWIKYITHFIIFIFNIFDNLHLNYGIIILLMTLVVKLALHPLTAKSIESAAKMRILAPELTALREKYGDDQARMSQEQMKLYSRAGVSPLGGCLPMLLQMPILMAMYYFFPASIELRQQAFLWATDLSSYDAVITWSKPILDTNHISLFTVLMTITSVLQAVMNNQLNTMGNQQPGMQYIPYIMPVMLMFIFNSFPAALTYYYLLQNLLGVAHQWIIQKFFIDEEKLKKKIEDNKKNPPKKSGWMKRLEGMQKQAEQQARERASKKRN